MFPLWGGTTYVAYAALNSQPATSPGPQLGFPKNQLTLTLNGTSGQEELSYAILVPQFDLSKILARARHARILGPTAGNIIVRATVILQWK